MAYIQREIQHIYPGKWEELEAIDKEFAKVEAKYGFSPKKRYQVMSGSEKMGTLIVEHYWENLAAMETAHGKLQADPEFQVLSTKIDTILKDDRVELLWVLP
jgi:Zn-finger domain-containing protein